MNVGWMKQTYSCMVKLCSHRARPNCCFEKRCKCLTLKSMPSERNFLWMGKAWRKWNDVTFSFAFDFRSVWTELYDDERFVCELRYSSTRCRSQYKPKYDTIDLNQCEVQKCLEESDDRLILIIFLNSHNLVLFSFIC